MQGIALLPILGCCCPLLTAHAQSPSPTPTPKGPAHPDLYVQESTNGIDFAKSRLFIERAQAASAVRDGTNRLIAAFQWLPGDETNAFERIGVAFSTDDAAMWTKPEPIILRGLPGGYEQPCDPTLALLENGKLRLYFTSRPTLRSRQQSIYSALSSDGVHYVFEPGRRFGFDDGKTNVTECAVGRSGKTFHLYAPVQDQPGRGYHATSADGLKFQRQADVTIPPPREWLGNVVAFRDGLGFYGSSREGMWVAFSRDGAAWQLNPRTGNRGADPAVLQARSGRFLRIYTSDLRPETDKARPLPTAAK